MHEIEPNAGLVMFDVDPEATGLVLQEAWASFRPIFEALLAPFGTFWLVLEVFMVVFGPRS